MRLRTEDMRCPNCGWVNPDGIERCEKCNTQLKSLPFEAEPEDQNIRSTVREVGVPFINQNHNNTCPHCGYPIRPETSSCPNCGNAIKEEHNKDIRFVSPAPQTGVVRDIGATVNPWSNPISVKAFKLQPIAWENEQRDIDPIQYNGERVELTRDNTDPVNNTITSKTQAEIFSEDGKWFIIDKSAQQSTFVQAGRKIELCDGDTIVLGNRKFVFKG